MTSLDLNLLAVLAVLLEERSVTAAARRLGVTQPAVSRSLARLRELFGDELLVRTPAGAQRTTLAESLAGPLRAALVRLERLVDSAGSFDPATARRSFSVAAVDYAHATLLAPLAAQLAREAPGISLVLRPVSPHAGAELWDELDLLIAPREAAPSGVIWSPLHAERYSCLVATTHPCPELDAQSLARFQHVLVAPWERPGAVLDTVLAEHGLARSVAVQTSSFLLLPYLLLGTERIATVPDRLARLLVQSHPLRRVDPPLPVPGFTLCLAWHELRQNDPAHRWLRERIARAASSSEE